MERGIVVILAIAGVASVAGVNTFTFFHPCQDVTGATSDSFTPARPVQWDEQAILAFTPSTRALFTNVTISNPTDQDGYGPAFLLNAYVDDGYWYQIGISYNWGTTSPRVGHSGGFGVVTAVFGPTLGDLLYEYNAPIGLHAGEVVRLGLELTSRCLVMSIDTGNATIDITYDAFHAKNFLAGPTSEDSPAYETSLMTEWWHSSPYRGPIANATYSLPEHVGSFMGLGIEEWHPFNGPVLFSNATQAHLGCGCTTQLSVENATATATPAAFFTG